MNRMVPHTMACIEAFLGHALASFRFVRAYPGYCRTCDGWDGKGSSYDPSPSGVSLSAGALWDVEPCPDCEGSEDVPACALCGQIMTEEGERLCACPKEAGLPPPPECLCWDIHLQEQGDTHE